ncbi:MAG: endonuclease NucS, partial [Thermoplasmatota archaeon]
PVRMRDTSRTVTLPASCSRVSFLERDGWFMVRAVHYGNREQMSVLFRHVEAMLVSAMEDRAELQLVGMEQDIVDKIMDSPEVIEPGLRITQREKQVPSGMIDLYGRDAGNVPVVIEVKRGQATLNAVQQLRMYVRDLRHGNPDAEVRGILCAPRIPEMVRRLLDDYKLEWQEFGWQHELDLDQQHSLDDYL